MTDRRSDAVGQRNGEPVGTSSDPPRQGVPPLGPAGEFKTGPPGHRALPRGDQTVADQSPPPGVELRIPRQGREAEPLVHSRLARTARDPRGTVPEFRSKRCGGGEHRPPRFHVRTVGAPRVVDGCQRPQHGPAAGTPGNATGSFGRRRRSAHGLRVMDALPLSDPKEDRAPLPCQRRPDSRRGGAWAALPGPEDSRGHIQQATVRPHEGPVPAPDRRAGRRRLLQHRPISGANTRRLCNDRPRIGRPSVRPDLSSNRLAFRGRSILVKHCLMDDSVESVHCLSPIMIQSDGVSCAQTTRNRRHSRIHRRRCQVDGSEALRASDVQEQPITVTSTANLNFAQSSPSYIGPCCLAAPFFSCQSSLQPASNRCGQADR